MKSNPIFGSQKYVSYRMHGGLNITSSENIILENYSMMYNNNYNLKYFVENKLSNLHPIIATPYAIIHQLPTTAANNTSIIVVRKTHLTAALCVVPYLFYIKRLFTNTFFKQRILIYMLMLTCGTLKMVTETSKTTNFRAHFFYNIG